MSMRRFKVGRDSKDTVHRCTICTGLILDTKSRMVHTDGTLMSPVGRRPLMLMQNYVISMR